MTANTQEVRQEVRYVVVSHMDPEYRLQASLYSSIKIWFLIDSLWGLITMMFSAYSQYVKHCA